MLRLRDNQVLQFNFPEDPRADYRTISPITPPPHTQSTHSCVPSFCPHSNPRCLWEYLRKLSLCVWRMCVHTVRLMWCNAPAAHLCVCVCVWSSNRREEVVFCVFRWKKPFKHTLAHTHMHTLPRAMSCEQQGVFIKSACACESTHAQKCCNIPSIPSVSAVKLFYSTLGNVNNEVPLL